MNLTKVKNFLRNSRQSIFCKRNEINLNDFKYFLFIDSKVENIIEQIYPYYQKNFLDKKRVVIIFRFHFENIRSIKKAFKKYGLIGHCLINLRDIPSIQDAIWFYTHNSMTNLAVINKNVYAKHLWLGHGDSDKVAYYKKIIRVYDYLLVSSENSINRLYKHEIFREEESYKFIRIGRAALCSILPISRKDITISKKTLLFAPTWEGAMKNENYSTLHLFEENANFIEKVVNFYKIDNIIIKFHPNTGLRNSEMIPYALKSIEALLALGKDITFIGEKDSWVYSWVFKKYKNSINFVNKLHSLTDFKIELAITNISAMESMTSGEGIKTFVLYDNEIDIQKCIQCQFSKKINLRALENSLRIEDVVYKAALINYEKNWSGLSEEDIFKELIKYVEGKPL